MPIDYAPESARIQRRGTVYLAFDDQLDVYQGYWDLEPDGPPTPLEQCPGSASAHDVLEWAGKRAPRVLIRPRDDPGTYYWAGDGDPPPGVPRFVPERPA